MSMKPGALAGIGDRIFVDGRPQTVTAVHTYAPGTPEAAMAPIKAGMVVRAVVTDAGTRHFGHLPGDRYRGTEITGMCVDGISFEDAPQATGYICKQCGDPSPVGVGYTTNAPATGDVETCPCGYSCTLGDV
jgi:hypothetical protein